MGGGRRLPPTVAAEGGHYPRKTPCKMAANGGHCGRQRRPQTLTGPPTAAPKPHNNGGPMLSIRRVGMQFGQADGAACGNTSLPNLQCAGVRGKGAAETQLWPPTAATKRTCGRPRRPQNPDGAAHGGPDTSCAVAAISRASARESTLGRLTGPPAATAACPICCALASVRGRWQPRHEERGTSRVRSRPACFT